MQFIQGQNRKQMVLIPDCLDSLIETDNEIRVIDLFVDSLDLKDFTFYVKQSQEGRPAYHPKDLLKLFIYGYLNSIRSSRKLEQECKRNIETMWLMKQLVPDHNTISNFRRDNSKSIKKVFRATVKMAQYFNLIGGTLIAGDSTKLRAQNSKKNNFNEKKIERHLAYIENKLEQYQLALAEADGDTDQQAEIQKEITKQQSRKVKYQALEKQITTSNQEQISTSDPESRQMITRNNITEVAYNVQSTTDGKHCIPIDFKVTNQNDSKAMGGMLRRAKVILKTKDFTGLYDKGYHTGSEFETADRIGVNVMVAIPDVASHAPDTNYDIANFKYNTDKDTFTCPEQHTLITNGNWYKKDRGKSVTFVKHYKTAACKNCPARNLCTKNPDGRLIERSQHAHFIEQNKKNIEANPKLYKRRQSIIEHNYGTIKRQWGFSYVLTKKGIKRATSDVGLMFVAYNLRRILNLIDPKVFKEYLRTLCLSILTKYGAYKVFLTHLSGNNFRNKHFLIFINQNLYGLNLLYLKSN